MVLDEIIANRDNDVRGVDGTGYHILGLQADREQAPRIVPRDRSFAHERADHTDAGCLGEEAKLLARASADGTVSGQDDRSPRVADDLHRPID